MAAIGAIVVEELDHAHVAIWISRHVGNRRPEDRIGIFGDGLFLLGFLLGGLALVELIRHLDQDFGVLGEVVAHDPLDARLVGRHRRPSGA